MRDSELQFINCPIGILGDQSLMSELSASIKKAFNKAPDCEEICGVKNLRLLDCFGSAVFLNVYFEALRGDNLILVEVSWLQPEID